MPTCSKLEDVEIGQVGGSSLEELPYPKSILAGFLGSAVAKEDTLVALRSYFDGSYKGSSWNDCELMSLAGFAAGDEIMDQFERDYDRVIHDDRFRPAADYLHMKKLRSQSGDSPFSPARGWNNERRTRLVTDVLELLESLDKSRSRLFVCSVEPKSLDNLRSRGIDLPMPVRICTHYCPHYVNSWHAHEYPGIISASHYFFDWNEPFEGDFKEIRKLQTGNSLEISGNRETWQLIKTMTSRSAEETPALQIADLLAWGTNRQRSNSQNGFLVGVAVQIKKIIPSSWLHVNETNAEEWCANVPR